MNGLESGGLPASSARRCQLVHWRAKRLGSRPVSALPLGLLLGAARVGIAAAADAPQSSAESRSRETPSEIAPAASDLTASPAVEVTVFGDKASGAAGYRVEQADLGPLGRRPVLDLPFAVYAVPKELLSAQSIHETHEAMRFIPSVQMEARFGMEFGPPIVRGFEVDDNSESTRIDGMNVRADTALPLDLYESYEVLTGPAGSLYGPTYAGGMTNAAQKRPTERTFQALSLEFRGNEHGELRVDLGGRFGPDAMFGYRVNGVHADGGVYAPGSNLQRNLGSVAFDVRLPTRTVVEVLASDYDYRQLGYPGGFTYGGTTGSSRLPAAPDPKLAGLGAPWAGMIANTRLFEIAAHQPVADGVQVEAGLLQQLADREFHNMMTHTFTDNAGDYTTTYRQSGSRGDVLSNKVYLNAKVATGSLRHQISAGSNGFRADAYSRPQVAAGTLSLGPGSLSAPTLGAEPGWIGPGPQYKTTRVTVQSAILNDTVSMGPVSLMLGGSLGWIRTRNFNAAGTKTSDNAADAVASGTVALLYKPREDMSAYANYADSIQPGEAASACTGNASKDLTNCGQTLAPERSQQVEVGYKWRVLDRLDLGLAAFRINRPFAFANAATHTFEVEGSQVNYGGEVTARGNLFEDLTAVAGLTVLDPKLENTQSDKTIHKQVVGIPVAQGNLLLEYRLPYVRGLAVDGGVHGRSRVPGDAANTTWARPFATFDAGIRYAYRMLGALTTASVGVTNLTNESYWASVRGSVSGDPAGSSSAFLGSPRIFRFGLALDL